MESAGDLQPAEWAEHAACWVAWPSAADLWLEHLLPAQRAFTAMCAAIADLDPRTRTARGERIHVLVPTEAREREALAALHAFAPVLHRVPFGDIWLRDTAPIFTRRGGVVGASVFAFNGWGGKYVLAHDDGVAAAVAGAAGLSTRTFPFVLEGGSVEVDGEGTCLTTRQCLLNPNRNPNMREAEITAALRDALGAEKVLWIDEGLVNDHTDGHIDTIARFCAPGVVVCMEPSGDDDPNARVLRAIAGELAKMRDARGRRFEVVRVPSPGRVVDEARGEQAGGPIMPASYVNFYIGNRAVVVPTYGSPFDDEAVEKIAALFPTRRAVGVPAKSILSGGGAFHCITQQQPA